MIQKRFKIYRIYFVIALLWGLLVTFIVPPLQAPDENRHFYRVETLSEGRWLCKGGKLEVAANDIKFVNQMDLNRVMSSPGEKFDWNSIFGYKESSNNEFKHVDNILCFDFPITYIHTATSFFITRSLGLNLLSGFYIARIINLLAAISITMFAIKVTPIGKGVLATLGLFPMFIYQAASLNYDAILIPSLFLFTALVFKLYFTKSLQKKDMVLLLLTSIVFVWTKPVYAPLLLILLCLDRKKLFTSRKQFIYYISFVFILFFGFYLQLKLNASINVIGQVKSGFLNRVYYVLNHKLDFLSMFLWSFIIFLPTYIRQLFGILGWMDYGLGNVLYSVLIIFFAFGFAIENKRKFLGRGMRLGLLGASSASVFLIFLAIYLYDNRVGIPLIYWVQGRYFLPLGFPVGMALKGGGGEYVKTDKMSTTLFYVVLIFVFLGTTYATIMRYN